MRETGNNLPDVMLLPEIARIYCVTVDDLFKENTRAYQNYAQRLLSVYEASGNSEDFLRAEKEFDRLLKTGDYTTDDLRCLGVLHHYMMKHSRENALKYFDLVIEKGCDGQDSEAYYRTCSQKIYLLSEIGRSAESIEQQTAELSKHPENPRLWLMLIFAYQHAGQVNAAYEQVKKALRKFPDDASLHVSAGDICRSLKYYNEAFSHWEKALALDDTYLDAKYSMGFCCEELGEYEKAYEIWNQVTAELEKRGFHIEKEWPAQMAKNCLCKMEQA